MKQAGSVIVIIGGVILVIGAIKGTWKDIIKAAMGSGGGGSGGEIRI